MNADSKRAPKRSGRMSGFTTMELLAVLTIAAVPTAISVPNVIRITQILRIGGDLRDLNGAVAQAKMHAGAGFTHAPSRTHFAAKTFHVASWNKTAGGGR